MTLVTLLVMYLYYVPMSWCAGPVPLLPKPTTSSQFQAFTFVPVADAAQKYSNLRVVSAESMDAKLCVRPVPLSQRGK